jgi:hypothetical protein
VHVSGPLRDHAQVSEWSAEAYGRVNTLQQWLAARALGHLELRGDERVLDVGSGDPGFGRRRRPPHGAVPGHRRPRAAQARADGGSLSVSTEQGRMALGAIVDLRLADDDGESRRRR